MVIFHYELDQGLQFESHLKLNESMANTYRADLLNSEYNHHSYAEASFNEVGDEASLVGIAAIFQDYVCKFSNI